jgi:hypothetical protein
MSFFDKKEDVLEVKLTQYGKKKYAEGKFNPKYYCFFDDNIIYNSDFAGFEENQSKIGERIKSETPSLKSFSLTPIESNIKADWNSNDDFEYNYNVENSLGDMSSESEYAPAYQINVLNGELANIDTHLTASESYTVKIPQLNCRDLEYIIKLMKKDDEDEEYDDTPIDHFDEGIEGNDLLEYTTEPNSLGHYLYVQGDYLLLEILEHNVDFSKENFEIELFEVYDDENGDKKVEKIPFAKEFNTIEKNLKPNYAQYYLDILVDEEIDDRVLCDKLNNRKEDIYSDNNRKCGDFVPFSFSNDDNSYEITQNDETDEEIC